MPYTAPVNAHICPILSLSGPTRFPYRPYRSLWISCAVHIISSTFPRRTVQFPYTSYTVPIGPYTCLIPSLAVHVGVVYGPYQRPRTSYTVPTNACTFPTPSRSVPLRILYCPDQFVYVSRAGPTRCHEPPIPSLPLPIHDLYRPALLLSVSNTVPISSHKRPIPSLSVPTHFPYQPYRPLCDRKGTPSQPYWAPSESDADGTGPNMTCTVLVGNRVCILRRSDIGRDGSGMVILQDGV